MAAFDWGKFANVDEFALAKGSAPIVSAHLANLLLQLEKVTREGEEGALPSLYSLY